MLPLAKLVNAYNRLFERTKEEAEGDAEPLEENYHENLEKECFSGAVAK